ncbi:MAG: YdcF family protein [Propionibacteriaceae bacterium]|nr:YdcF family protein [Propionibacteriaceae bacterium]
MSKVNKSKRQSSADKETTNKKSHPSRRKIMVVSVLVALVLMLSPLVVTSVASDGRSYTVDTVDPHDVVIVFGAGLYGDQPTPYLKARLTIARDLYNSGKVRAILLTGDNLTEHHNEPAVMKKWLIDHGIPEDVIVLDHAGEDTYTSCVRARKIFGVTSAIIVSQEYHLPRAISVCRLVGVDVVAVGDPYDPEYNGWKWWRYTAREYPATVKMILDVLRGREPILGDYETGVDEVLGR